MTEFRIVRRKSVIILVFFGLLIVTILRIILVSPAPGDLKALNQPLYGPIIDAGKVNIEVISVNGTHAPGNSLTDAVSAFDRYVRGDVRLVEAPPVQLDLKGGESLTLEQTKTILEERPYRAPSDVSLLLLPTADFVGKGRICGYCYSPADRSVGGA